MIENKDLEFNDEIDPTDKKIIAVCQHLQSLLDSDLSSDIIDQAEAFLKRQGDKGEVIEQIKADLAEIRDTKDFDAAKAEKYLVDAVGAAKGATQADKDYAPVIEEDLEMWEDVGPREWLIDQFLPANELTLFTGQGGVGKSRLMLQIVGKLACGWGGTPFQAKERHLSNNQDNKRVYIASWEDDRDEHKRRLLQAQRRLGWMEEGVFNRQVKFADMRNDGRGPLWGVPPGGNSHARASLLPVGEVLLKQVAAFEADVLVLDPLSAAFGGNENDRAGAREFNTHLSGWANRNRCAVVILGHPPKSDATYSGSTDWEGAPRAMWFLEKDEQKDQGALARYKFDVTKLSYAAKPERPRHLELDRGVWIEQDNKGASNEEPRINTHGVTRNRR